MRLAVLLISLSMNLSLMSQGLLRSRIIQTDSVKVCTLTVRNFDNWDSPVDHLFRVSTATYLLPGDYLVRYYMDSVWLHAEFIHISTKFTIMEKVIMEKPIPLHQVRFVKPKRGDYGYYLEY